MLRTDSKDEQQRSMHNNAMAPTSGECRLFLHNCKTYINDPFAPVLNALDVVEGLKRKHCPGCPPSSTGKGKASYEPPDHGVRPEKAFVCGIQQRKTIIRQRS
jgi:hypothetical protein